MGKKHDDPRGKQKGAQQHAEGQHGEKARAHLVEELQAEGRQDRDDVEQRDRARAGQHPDDGGHRLTDGRAQHDPADRAADQNRLDIDVERHGHDRSRVQTRGGTASHPELPDEDSDVRSPHRR
jgi:hypothetical protein